MRAPRNFFLLLPVLILYSCASPPPSRDNGIDTAVSPPGTEISAWPEPKDPPAVSPALAPAHDLTIVAVGDNLYHEVMFRDGEEGDYETVYSGIRNLTEKADIAFINQETLLAGEDLGLSGYPLFNSPQKLGQAVAAIGFNVVNHATNHIMDKGEAGVFRTMDFWDALHEVTVLGIHPSEEVRNLPKLVEKNNITLGFLSYTYGTNGIGIPEDKPYLVSLIDTEIMAGEIDALRPLCDFLVVSMHWGDEYQFEINENQETLSCFLAEHQVDLVLGHHPHVIQPIEYILRPDGKFMLCYYSLGNFISAQTQTPTFLGAMAYIRIEKIPDHEGNTESAIIFTDAGAIPLVTHYEKGFTGFKVYPLFAYTDELAEKHWKNQGSGELTLEYLNSLAAKTLGEMEIQYSPFY